MRPGRARRSGLAALALGLSPACGGGAPEGGPVVLVTLDTTRVDALGCYSGRSGVTPRLDELARESRRFTWARSVTPMTLPSHSSLMSGLYPPRNRVRVNGAGGLPQAAETLAERAREAGYDTAAFVSAAVLERGFGLDQGFDVYDEPTAASRAGGRIGERSAQEVTDAALAWLQARERGRPYFLWLHYFDAHAPYAPPEAFLAAAGGDPYLGEVALVDHHVGRLLDALRERGDWARCSVAVVGDHGEGLGQHGEEAHGFLCYDTTLRVPLILRDPSGAGAGQTSDAVVSVVDLYPTLLAAMGLAPRGDHDGVSLWGGASPPERGLYFESYYGFATFGWSPIAGWVRGSWKYLHSSAPELYDVSDPREHDDRSAERPDLVEAARRALEAVGRAPGLAPDADDGVPDDALRARIAALGYADAGTSARDYPPPLEGADGPAPRDRLQEGERLLDAKSLVGRGKAPRAIRMLRELVDTDPASGRALDYLCALLAQQGQCDEAVERLERALAAGPGRARTHLTLGACLLERGDDARAVEHLERTLELDPAETAAARFLAQLYEERGDEGEAERYRRLATERGDR